MYELTVNSANLPLFLCRNIRNDGKDNSFHDGLSATDEQDDRGRPNMAHVPIELPTIGGDHPLQERKSAFA